MSDQSLNVRYGTSRSPPEIAFLIYLFAHIGHRDERNSEGGGLVRIGGL